VQRVAEADEQGVARRHDFLNEREALTTGQNSYAGILSCADSRIAPEYAFDAGRGDLFVCRVAGNFLNDDGLASFEYAVQVLGTPLLMVLGHQACGAVDAAIKSVGEGTTLPGHLPALVTALTPAVKSASGQSGNVLDNTIKQNVLLNVERLKSANPIVSKFVADIRFASSAASTSSTRGRSKSCNNRAAEVGPLSDRATSAMAAHAGSKRHDLRLAVRHRPRCEQSHNRVSEKDGDCQISAKKPWQFAKPWGLRDFSGVWWRLACRCFLALAAPICSKCRRSVSAS
jgi:carbonic anhydrase